jgi:hypothetical protein
MRWVQAYAVNCERSATCTSAPFGGTATRPATSLCIHPRALDSDRPARPRSYHKASFLPVYIPFSTTPTPYRQNPPIMTNTIDLDNIDPATQMPSSGDYSAPLEPIDTDTANQPVHTGDDQAKSPNWSTPSSLSHYQCPRMAKNLAWSALKTCVRSCEGWVA